MMMWREYLENIVIFQRIIDENLASVKRFSDVLSTISLVFSCLQLSSMVFFHHKVIVRTSFSSCRLSMPSLAALCFPVELFFARSFYLSKNTDGRQIRSTGGAGFVIIKVIFKKSLLSEAHYRGRCKTFTSDIKSVHFFENSCAQILF